jgi:integrase/recombinase XerD
VQRVKNFAAFLGRSPDMASFEDVRRYQLHLSASGVGVPTINQTVSTLRFFFRVTLKRHEIIEHTHVVHEPRKLPVVLSVEEVARLLDAAPAGNIARARELLAVAKLEANPTAAVDANKPACPCCGGRMIIIEVFARGATPRHWPTGPATVIRIDTS